MEDLDLFPSMQEAYRYWNDFCPKAANVRDFQPHTQEHVQTTTNSDEEEPQHPSANCIGNQLFVCVSNGCTNLRIPRIFGEFLFDCNSLFGITGFGSMARGVNKPLRQIRIELSADCLVLV
ncbi:predicted protein [Histoplasma capsulatum H143]|nr:predicted protein [Histoplasma capsulatum H143]